MPVTPETILNDPLLYAAPLPYVMRYYPQGFPVDLACDSRNVVEAAQQSWGAYQARFATPPLRVHVMTQPGSRELPPEPSFRGQRHLTTIVSDRENFAICDRIAGFAFCLVTETTAADPVFFRWHFLEAMVYMLHEQTHYIALHAACVAFHGAGVLLYGESGVGKSTLSYACARRGWTYIGDDGSCLVWNSGRTVIGECHHFRFRAEAADLFPELRGLTVGRELNRKPTIEVNTADLPNRTAPDCRIERIVFVDRQPGMSAHLTAVSRDQARERLMETPMSDVEVQERHEQEIDSLLEAPAYQLCYGNYEEAVLLLEEFVRAREES
jgi:hypothetical protein